MKYVVRITEKLVKHVVVEADSTEEAEDKVSDAHRKAKVVLDYDDYEDVEFEWIREAHDDDIANYIDVGDL